jgi:predicted P-loop ATPase
MSNLPQNLDTSPSKNGSAPATSISQTHCDTGCADKNQGLGVTAIEYEQAVGKPYGLTDGVVVKSGESHRSRSAVGVTKSFDSFDDFADWRKSLKTNYILVSGTFAKLGEVLVVLKGSESGDAVSATKVYLAHREQPGILIVDIDSKKPDEVAGLYPDGVQPYSEFDAVLEDLDTIAPEARKCALMIGWSTSSNLFDKDGHQVKGTGGIRIYIPVTNASMIPEIIEIWHKRCWLHGKGWAFVGKGGRFYERSVVDKVMARPHQPDFVAPHLKDGLTQDRGWVVYEGDYLDSATVKPLTPDEEARYVQAVDTAKVALGPAMASQRAAKITEETTKGIEKGQSPARAKSAAIKLLDSDTLNTSMSVIFDDGTEVSCLELMTNGEQYDDKTCKDPIEPGYDGGASVGKFYWNEGERAGIHSFAHGSKWYAIKHDVIGFNDFIEKATKADFKTVISAFILTEFESETEKTLAEEGAAKAVGLGRKVTAFRKDVAAELKRRRGKSAGNGLDGSDQKAISDGRWPVDAALPTEIFPAKKDGALLSHADNYKTMMSACGYGCSYDVIKKYIFWTGPQINMTTDNAYLVLFSKMKGLSAINGLPHSNADLNSHLPAIAEENQINPVRDYLAALEWDGRDRIGSLVQAIGPHDTAIAEIALRVWFTGAAAACEHFETGLKLVHGARPSFEYVLAILGDQGVNKTKGFLGLVPKALAKYAKDGLSIKTENKDSVKIAVSYWLVELGELDATFRQGQIAELKAFLSTEADELRLPYAQGYSKFKRRTAFIGTVNQDKFLKDATGNRRYLALDCTSGFPLWSSGEVDQLWAQAWARYVGGAQWWPTTDEQKLLDVNAERFLQLSWAETRIRELYDFSRLTDNNKRVTTTNLWAELHGAEGRYGNTREIKPQQLNELRAAMIKLWGEHGAKKRKGEQIVDTKNGTVKTYADGGNNKGWLMPSTVDEVEKADAKRAKQIERVEHVTALSTEIQNNLGLKGKSPDVVDVRKLVMSMLKKEFDERGKTAIFPGTFPQEEWVIAYDEAEGLWGVL